MSASYLWTYDQPTLTLFCLFFLSLKKQLPQLPWCPLFMRSTRTKTVSCTLYIAEKTLLVTEWGERRVALAMREREPFLRLIDLKFVYQKSICFSLFSLEWEKGTILFSDKMTTTKTAKLDIGEESQSKTNSPKQQPHHPKKHSKKTVNYSPRDSDQKKKPLGHGPWM